MTNTCASVFFCFFFFYSYSCRNPFINSNLLAVRTTLGLNAAGWSPGDVGRTKWVAKGKRYLIRVAEMEPYLTATFGRAYARGGSGTLSSTPDAQGNLVFDPPAELKGKVRVQRINRLLDINFFPRPELSISLIAAGVTPPAILTFGMAPTFAPMLTLTSARMSSCSTFALPFDPLTIRLSSPI